MIIKDVFDDMKIVIESWGIDEYTKKYNEDGYELVKKNLLNPKHVMNLLMK